MKSAFQVRGKKVSTNTLIIASILLSLFVLNAFLLIRYSSLKQLKAVEDIRNQTYKAAIKEQLFRFTSLNPTTLHDSIYFYQHLYKDSVFIERLFEVPRMVLYFEQSDCAPCQENAIERIQKFVNKSNYIIVIKSDSRAWLNSMEKNLNGQNIYALKSDWGIPAIYKVAPVYFTLTIFYMATNWFVPDEVNLELTRAYFEEFNKAVQTSATGKARAD
jgi:hypothetical protein